MKGFMLLALLVVVQLYGSALAFPQKLHHQDPAPVKDAAPEKELHPVKEHAPEEEHTPVKHPLVPLVPALPVLLADVQKGDDTDDHKKGIENIIKSTIGSAVVAVNGNVYYELEGFHK